MLRKRASAESVPLLAFLRYAPGQLVHAVAQPLHVTGDVHRQAQFVQLTEATNQPGVDRLPAFAFTSFGAPGCLPGERSLLGL